MNEESETAGRAIAKYVVEGRAAEALTVSRPSWHRWSCRLSSGSTLERISVCEAVEDAVEAIVAAANLGLEPRLVVQSLDSPIITAMLERDLPDVGVAVAETDPGDTLDLLGSPDEWLVDGWESFCSEPQGWSTDAVDLLDDDWLTVPEDPAIKGAVVDAFVEFVAQLPEPDRMHLTPRRTQLQEIPADQGIWTDLANAFFRDGLARWESDYQEMLGSRRAWLRALGTQGLGHLAIVDDDRIELLKQKAAQDPDDKVRAAARDALSSLIPGDNDDQPALKPEATPAPVIQAVLGRLRKAPEDVRKLLADAAALVSTLESEFAMAGARRGATASAAGFATGGAGGKDRPRVRVESADGVLRGHLVVEPYGDVEVILYAADTRLAGRKVVLGFYRSNGTDVTALIEPLRMELTRDGSGDGVTAAATIDGLELGELPEDLMWDLRVLDAE